MIWAGLLQARRSVEDSIPVRYPPHSLPFTHRDVLHNNRAPETPPSTTRDQLHASQSSLSAFPSSPSPSPTNPPSTPSLHIHPPKTTAPGPATTNPATTTAPTLATRAPISSPAFSFFFPPSTRPSTSHPWKTIHAHVATCVGAASRPARSDGSTPAERTRAVRRARWASARRAVRRARGRARGEAVGVVVGWV